MPAQLLGLPLSESWPSCSYADFMFPSLESLNADTTASRTPGTGEMAAACLRPDKKVIVALKEQ